MKEILYKSMRVGITPVLHLSKLSNCILRFCLSILIKHYILIKHVLEDPSPGHVSQGVLLVINSNGERGRMELLSVMVGRQPWPRVPMS